MVFSNDRPRVRITGAASDITFCGAHIVVRLRFRGNQETPNNLTTDGAFVGVDNSFIMAAANAALSGISLPSGGFGWSAFDGGWNVTNLGPLSGLSIADNGAMVSLLCNPRTHVSCSYLAAL